MNGVHFESFGSLLLTIAFGFGMITYYSQPIPGIGIQLLSPHRGSGSESFESTEPSLVQEVWDRLNTITSAWKCRRSRLC